MLKGRIKDRGGFILGATVIFALIFSLLLVLYIYLMQRSWVVSDRALYLYKDVLLAAHKMALYDITTGRYRDNGAGRNNLFYDSYWQTNGATPPTRYEAVYKVPVRITSETTDCNIVALQGDNCVTITDVPEFKRVRAVYELTEGHWVLTLTEVN